MQQNNLVQTQLEFFFALKVCPYPNKKLTQPNGFLNAYSLVQTSVSVDQIDF